MSTSTRPQKREKTLHQLVKMSDSLSMDPKELLNQKRAEEIDDLCTALNNCFFMLCRKLHEAGIEPKKVAAVLFSKTDELSCDAAKEFLSLGKRLNELSFVDLAYSARLHPLVISGISMDDSYICKVGDTLGSHHAAEKSVEKRLIAMCNAVFK